MRWSTVSYALAKSKATRAYFCSPGFRQVPAVLYQLGEAAIGSRVEASPSRGVRAGWLDARQQDGGRRSESLAPGPLPEPPRRRLLPHPSGGPARLEWLIEWYELKLLGATLDRTLTFGPPCRNLRRRVRPQPLSYGR